MCFAVPEHPRSNRSPDATIAQNNLLSGMSE